MEQLELFYVELRDWQRGVSPPKLAIYARQHLTLYLELGRVHLALRSHQQDGWIHWRSYPKHHLWLHMAEEGLDCRGTWTYADESAIGILVKVAESTHPSRIHRTVLKKFRL